MNEAVYQTKNTSEPINEPIQQITEPENLNTDLEKIKNTSKEEHDMTEIESLKEKLSEECKYDKVITEELSHELNITKANKKDTESLIRPIISEINRGYNGEDIQNIGQNFKVSKESHLKFPPKVTDHVDYLPKHNETPVFFN